ncbi:MAG: hypothetical protein NUV82_00340 [Candidatus Komeilibacteria bacterium]|nr:hypothetical protein [Candidatus Komeilibacteria bacterium]
MDEVQSPPDERSDMDMDALAGIQLTLSKIEDELQKVKLQIAKQGISAGTSPDFREKLEALSQQDGEEKVVEGVFNGQQMVGPDGKHYSIPANYASKSKLVEGDILKLRILPDGSFVYKQIGPVDRDRKVGKLIKDERGNYAVMVENKVFRVILAAVTYFHGLEGDEAIILVPKDTDSEWAAIENIIKSSTR